MSEPSPAADASWTRPGLSAPPRSPAPEPSRPSVRTCARAASLVLALTALSPTRVAFADVATRATARACTVREVSALCAPAVPGALSVDVACGIDFATLDCERAAGRPNVVTRRLRLAGPAASGVVADFDGAHLDAGPGTPNHGRGDIVEILSTREADGRWRRPEDVTLRNARVTGSIRVHGMGRNAEAEPVRDSSRRPGHLARVREAAPRGIVLERLAIEGTGRNPVYFGPGVTGSALRGSTLGGRSTRVGIYLDAESGDIAIEGNTIGVVTDDASVLGFYDRGWPQVAIDGSGGNRVVGNRFTRLAQGGVFLYRNCGEGGTVRHASPSGNVVADNVFELDGAARDDPVIRLGSRGYGRWESAVPGSHCDDDEGPWPRVGSARDNGDFASGNTVAGNRFETDTVPATAADRRAALARLIRAGTPRAANLVERNVLVGRRLPEDAP